MKTERTRLDLLTEFELSPPTALFPQTTLAAIRECSLALLERDRWAGTGVPFIKIGRSVRYRKSDVLVWLAQHQPVQSTSQFQAERGNLKCL